MRYQSAKPQISPAQIKKIPLTSTLLIGLIREVLSKNTSFRFRVKGFSMHPFIKDNDVITISPLKKNLTQTGDIVAFVNPRTDKLTIHRILKKNGNTYLAMGDNVSRVDGFIRQENILGRVTKIERNGKKCILGLGLERYLIVVLNRKKLLFRLSPVRKLIPSFIKRLIV